MLNLPEAVKSNLAEAGKKGQQHLARTAPKPRNNQFSLSIAYACEVHSANLPICREHGNLAGQGGNRSGPTDPKKSNTTFIYGIAYER